MMYIKLSNDTTGGAAKSSKSQEVSVSEAESATNSVPDDPTSVFPDMDSDSRKHFMVIFGWVYFVMLQTCGKAVDCIYEI